VEAQEFSHRMAQLGLHVVLCVTDAVHYADRQMYE